MTLGALLALCKSFSMQKSTVLCANAAKRVKKQQTEKKGYPKWWNQDNSEESNQTEKVDDEELCRIMESLNTEKEEDL